MTTTKPMKTVKLPHHLNPNIKYLYLKDDLLTDKEWANLDHDLVWSLEDQHQVFLDEISDRVLTIARLINTTEDNKKVVRFAKALNACECSSQRVTPEGEVLPSDRFSKRMAQLISGGRLLKARGDSCEFLPLGEEKPIETIIKHLLSSNNYFVRKIALKAYLRCLVRDRLAKEKHGQDTP